MNLPVSIPVGVELRSQIEYRVDRPRKPYRARARWTIATGVRQTKSEPFADEADAVAWITRMKQQAQGGLSPAVAAMTVAAYGEEVMRLATRGLESKSIESYERLAVARDPDARPLARAYAHERRGRRVD